MIEILAGIWTNDLYRKIILTIFILIVGSVLRRIFLLLIHSRVSDDSPHIYPISKVTGYSVSIMVVIILFAIWVQQIGDLTVTLGFMAAGVAFALQEIIGSIAGWMTIIGGRPFTVGDRIETGGIRGDVVDIGILRTTVMEIGNWLNGDHNTGRIVTVSNAYIFKEPLFNYSARLPYIWDEVTIPITYESDMKRAVEIMTKAVRDHPVYNELLPRAQEQRRRARRELAVKITPLEPKAFVRLTDNWIELGVVYPVDIDQRRLFRSEISMLILNDFKQADIKIASQTISIVNFPGSPSPIQ